MSFKELKTTLDDEVSIILSNEFAVQVTNTETVPGSDDGAITFPNFDSKTQGAKLIDTAVLYIDIRRSTDLNLAHKPRTVAKLYSAFIRAMTHVARHHHGHVRGIIGDRLMVLFDSDGAGANAVECAFSMNTVGQHVLNKHFKANDVTFGIGIDCGKMLATKTGIRRHGHEQANYRNLVWLGRPANIASKLTDLANKPAESVEIPAVRVAYEQVPRRLALLSEALSSPPNTYPASALAAALLPAPRNGLINLLASVDPAPKKGLINVLASLDPAPQNSLSALSPEWQWQTESMPNFIGNLEMQYSPTAIRHKNPRFVSFLPDTQSVQIRPATPPILMTLAVWDAYRAAKPHAKTVKEGWVKPVAIRVPGYPGSVFGCDVIYPELRD